MLNSVYFLQPFYVPQNSYLHRKWHQCPFYIINTIEIYSVWCLDPDIMAFDFDSVKLNSSIKSFTFARSEKALLISIISINRLAHKKLPRTSVRRSVLAFRLLKIVIENKYYTVMFCLQELLDCNQMYECLPLILCTINYI